MELISFLIGILILVLVVQAILTWIPTDPDSPVYSVQTFLAKVTNPIYAPVRRILPPVGGSGIRVDLTPMLVILALVIIRSIL